MGRVQGRGEDCGWWWNEEGRGSACLEFSRDPARGTAAMGSRRGSRACARGGEDLEECGGGDGVLGVARDGLYIGVAEEGRPRTRGRGSGAAVRIRQRL